MQFQDIPLSIRRLILLKGMLTTTPLPIKNAFSSSALPVYRNRKAKMKVFFASLQHMKLAVE
ncbi:MAG TPA: hypothetical protein DHW50_09195 [Akkermansia sp.]|uniref:Uncharacterized protein n=1 Tax=Akkermansia massiliensis TaxID=2927224 RepID=A0AAE6W0Q5_9BACT|nr:hypothetical protein [Akkermansia muciniphila]QHV62083.1 hypothetical protein DMI76_01240 [Akkermansia massiliensis]HCL33821.1 hypothetical protein [Akkermansia sp.]PNC20490.1 hypothetical protein CXU18_06480 [Akkermansia muciniphila]PNC48940.1 hypothetical protein CXU11_07630 [Akkermansia muciniphila]